MRNDQKEKEIIALKALFSRYKLIVENNEEVFKSSTLPDKCQYSSLLRLINEAYENTSKYPSDKMHRWLGFTQGVLAVMELIDVDTERDYTRPYLHSYHNDKPETF